MASRQPNSFSPGFVATRFGDEAGGLAAPALRAGKLFAKTPEEGARTLLYLASAPAISGVNGEFFYKCRPGRITAEASDAGKGRRLWTESERIAKCAAA